MADTKHLRELDKRYLWHPFTQMADWCAPEHDPLVIVSGKGVVLRDSEGNEYLDGNSSIWTNIHGHGHPVINQAICDQVGKLAHCSALGFSNEPAIQLAEKLTALLPGSPLSRVFYSDDGSTAIECACKMAIQFRQLTGQPQRNRFLAFENAYHGDTAGAASLGGIGSFTGRFSGTGFKAHSVPDLESLEQIPANELAEITAVCIEPVIQGAAGMRTWPTGMLACLRKWCDAHDIFLILDEVMTGFGRTGKMFACQHEDVVPDFLCLAKGLTGGYLPLAATLTTEKVFEAFLGGYDDTFFYGHSYCANPIGCAAALGSLDVFEKEHVLEGLPAKIEHFRNELTTHFNELECVVEIRQAGLTAGIEITPSAGDRTGAKVCLEARQFGLLTRPVRNTLVLMPPLCSSQNEISEMTTALRRALDHVVR
ncbi:MAG: adenosylmethionine--8-amino-7-oxononanoate transaminase [Verrucomicrobiales bacterium]|nr:adenosylmethionine--8-amino-7-oxononanoate transaminase [Verrucomicrobiales bacterium]